MLPASLGALSLDSAPLFLDVLALPRPLVVVIFLLIPVDTRLRCVEVSRAWRALLADTTFWDVLILSVSSGVTRFTVPLFRAAVAKAGGQLRALDVTGQSRWDTIGRNLLPAYVRQHYVPLAQQHHATARLHVREAAAANTALVELRLDTGAFYFADEVRALLEAAPALKLLELSFCIYRDQQLTRAVLRNEPPYEALRIRRLFMSHALQSVDAFCVDVRQHASLEALRLASTFLGEPLVMGALVDACTRLRTLELVGCDILPASLPGLTRLVAAGALRELVLEGTPRSPFDEAGDATQRFVAAVRSSVMTKLHLIRIGTGALPAAVTEAMALINARRV